MAPVKVILLACGSFNPPTNMHLRMFEVARDTLNHLGQYVVIGGVISPVHDAYGKKELVPSMYRYEMCKLALQSSDWIRISNWECSQDSWITTRQVLQYHQNVLNSVLNNDSNSAQNVNHINANECYTDSWITNEIRNTQGPVQVKLLCGADLLHTFTIPGLWKETDIETILHHHGIVVVSRQGYNPYQFIYESDLLNKYQNNIIIINEWVVNEISSTKVRRALRRQESVKYLIENSVIDFIYKKGLYGCLRNEHKYALKSNINEASLLSIPSCVNDFILTPSPSDVNMKSVSTSGENIYLELTDLRGEQEKNSTTTAATKTKAKMSTRKVGFATPDDDNGAGAGSDEFRSPECSAVDESPSSPGCRRSRRSSTESKMCRSGESEATCRTANSTWQSGTNPMLLRRSNSDAVMMSPRLRDKNGDATPVTIQFTKDGIRVISDKESIV